MSDAATGMADAANDLPLAAMDASNAANATLFTARRRSYAATRVSGIRQEMSDVAPALLCRMAVPAGGRLSPPSTTDRRLKADSHAEVETSQPVHDNHRRSWLAGRLEAEIAAQSLKPWDGAIPLLPKSRPPRSLPLSMVLKWEPPPGHKCWTTAPGSWYFNRGR